MKEIKPGPLVREALAGSEEAFSQLIGLYKQSMYATAMAVTHNEQDALDAIQETVLTLWLKLHTLQKPDYFKTWMTRILLNQCCSIMRKHKKETPFDLLPEDSTKEKDQDTPLDVAAAMQRLREDDRLVLQLFYYEDLSVKQVGEALGLSYAAVRMRLSRGRRRFTEQYTDQTQEVRYEKK